MGNCVGGKFRAYTTCPSGQDDLWCCEQRPSEKSSGTKEAECEGSIRRSSFTMQRRTVDRRTAWSKFHYARNICWRLSRTDHFVLVSRAWLRLLRSLAEKRIAFKRGHHGFSRSYLPACKHDRVKLIDTWRPALLPSSGRKRCAWRKVRKESYDRLVVAGRYICSFPDQQFGKLWRIGAK